MWKINHSYIDGTFVPVQGNETVQCINPATEAVIGTVTLADREDARRAIAAASRAQVAMGHTSKAERIEMLEQLQAAVLASTNEIRDTAIEEYGAPFARAQWVSRYASQSFANAAQVLKNYDLVRSVGDATVVMEPVGVAALIAPWNSTAGTICSKLASAIAAGCASVIKPSELSPLQTDVLAQALHRADLPKGVFNILLGRGSDVGDEISTSPHVAKISFTGSTATGKLIARAGIETMKRVSLSLTGKSASIVLDDADLDSAIPLALNAAFMNNGQACVAGTRLLVPRKHAEDIIDRVKNLVGAMVVGNPQDPATVIGPLVSRAQFERVQGYIRRGQAQGATLITGGEGRPIGLDKGYFVRPTVFTDVTGDMDIAQEEIFGPVLSVIAYDSPEQAIDIANASIYGLQAYVFSRQPERARSLAARLQAGSVLINRIAPELLAPFGGVKQSGIGREFGVFGLEAFLEAKSIVSD
ncbi:aldehyde dehydrogenase family protein [Pseudomonas sp. ADAK2]|uniref:aldehyde dehydrogenase family protein n=1 Tax=Pseudomonas TaxID=286 RepID=UPI00146360CD|nr:MULTISPECIES: aldehyde dehydrogenase family protein [unclassified Pseudomonas]QJI45435.1 aldehyde dehydrogenase family protein [Pseudomonas sp. ADAK7]QJI51736.1 aldehyde dehydrogenase family protein [Pseudomonas sp. ADAK2]